MDHAVADQVAAAVGDVQPAGERQFLARDRDQRVGAQAQRDLRAVEEHARRQPGAGIEPAEGMRRIDSLRVTDAGKADERPGL